MSQENNTHPEPNPNQDDNQSDEDEVFQTKQNEGDPTIPRPRGRPPTMPKLQQKLAEANSVI
jgi:hypothetical protein